MTTAAVTKKSGGYLIFLFHQACYLCPMGPTFGWKVTGREWKRKDKTRPHGIFGRASSSHLGALHQQ